ncbi:MAG: hypothetical protein MUE66_09310, partial [Acidimicrobiia bacterium]|nr:hypothetical protein [Acidimicrobiia bacterium]
MSTAVAEDRLTALEAKLDAVSHQLDFVAATLREQEVRRGMWDELRHDLAPITAEAMGRVTQELDEVRGFIEPEAMLRLLKRLLRDLPYLEALLDQVESLSSLGADVAPLGRAMVLTAMAGLDDLEQRGYFAFARGLKHLADGVVGGLGADDLQALGQSVPALVQSVKELADPGVMSLLPGLVRALQETPAETPGLLRLAWRLRRPAARRGLGRALGLLEALGTPAAA